MELLERLNQLNLALFELRNKAYRTVGDVWTMTDIEDEIDDIKATLNEEQELEYKEVK